MSNLPGMHLIGLTVLTGLGLSLVSMPIFLRWAKGHGWGQEVREEGPKAHLSKAGTPTMGGIVLIMAGLLASFWAPNTLDLWIFRMVTVVCAVLGMTDDLSKLMKHRSLGLKARHKMAALLGLGLALFVYLYFTREPLGINVPFLGFVSSAWAMLGITLFLTSGTVNAVNLTDGLDGLAGGTCTVALLAYSAMAAYTGHMELCLAAVAMAGACVGFLWYNVFPARVFMGDTGSLALGGALAALALLTGTEFLLVVIGGIFVVEALSVIIQVSYFKLTNGQRIFKMSPLHHHFELSGLHEVQVTSRFVIASVVLALVGVLYYVGGLS
ncbi:MAG: phospho-N-acetylmuramoyl-pentapeptide-transferase [Candidatus Bruticola sp.]